jgi:hypothetical protein
MDWYWWVVIAVVAYFVIKSAFSSARRTASPKPAHDDFAFLKRVRERDAAVDRALAQVVDRILALPVVPPNPAYGSTLARDAVESSVSNFMQSAGRTGAGTSTKMLHVVLSPLRLTAFVKLRPTEPQAAMREFIRIADDSWAFRTRPVDDMNSAVAAAKRAAAQLEAELKASAESSKGKSGRALNTSSPRPAGMLGILFDIDALGGGFYGKAAYQILFKSVDDTMLRDFKLYDGDTTHTPAPANVRLYCIAVETNDVALLEHIESRLAASQEPGLRPPGSRFLRDVESIRREPLVFAGAIDVDGVLDGCDTPWILEAWQADLKMVYDVVLEEAGDDPHAAMRELRSLVPQLGLAEAKALIEHAPTTIVASLPKHEAIEVRRRLEEAGAKVTIR